MPGSTDTPHKTRKEEAPADRGGGLLEYGQGSVVTAIRCLAIVTAHDVIKDWSMGTPRRIPAKECQFT